jgi:hypothetical protein
MSKRQVIIGSVLLGLTGLCGVVYAVMQLNQPVQGVIKVGPAKPGPDSFTVSLAPKTQTGRYASFSYPAGMTPRRPEPVRAPYVASYAYNARNVESWVLAVDIANNPTGTLSGNSSYNLRKNNPAQYLESQTIVNGQTVTVMTDITVGSFSKVAYFTHGHLLATVSLLGNDASGTQPLQTSFDMALSSWHWLP